MSDCGEESDLRFAGLLRYRFSDKSKERSLLIGFTQNIVYSIGKAVIR